MMGQPTSVGELTFWVATSQSRKDRALYRLSSPIFEKAAQPVHDAGPSDR